MLKPNQPTIASYCSSQACVEVTYTDRIVVRDTKPGGAAVVFTLDAWRHAVAGLKAEGLIEKESPTNA